MTGPSQPAQFPGKWSAFGGASLVFFFLNAATFTSLGVVLFTMGAELHWSMTYAGLSFTVLGLACGLSSPLAAITMVRLGGGLSLCMGAALVAIGFLIASVCHTLPVFFVAMLFLGIGFTLSANVPGVYVLAGWFQRQSPGIIGYYMMLGALGAAFGPPVVEAIVRHAGWRIHWQVMAASAAAIAVLCRLLVRDAPADRKTTQTETAPADWTPRQAMLTRQFLLVAAAMTMTMFSVTTNSSALVAHLVRLGATPEAASFVLSASALTATLVKGGSGRLSAYVAASTLLGAGLIFQAAGCLLIAVANSTVLHYAAALTFGTGWGLSFVSSTIVPLEYFGAATGAKVLSIVALLTTLAAIGPFAAGWVADLTGSFAPVYNVYAVVLVVLAVPVLLMRTPRKEGVLF